MRIEKFYKLFDSYKKGFVKAETFAILDQLFGADLKSS